MKTISQLNSSIAAVFSSMLLLSPVFAGEYVLSPKEVQYSAPVDTSFYFEGFGGGLFLDDLAGSGAANVNADFDTGWIAGGTFGYEFAPGFSFEIEGATGESDLEGLAVNGVRAGFAGDLSYSQVAVNFIYELMPRRAFTPYVGVGIGAGFADAEFAAPGFRMNDDDAAFLYQLIGGVKWEINPRSSFFAEYRFGSLDEFSLQSSAGEVTFDELQSHQAVLGFQFNF